MTAYYGIECLLALIIIENFTFIAANIIDKLFEWSQITKTIEIIAGLLVRFIVAHPMRACTLLSI